MKTDHDLLDEAFRHLWASTGAPPWKVELMMQQWRLDQSHFQRRPPQPLTDAEYAAKLKQLLAELPAMAASLRTRPPGELPTKFFGGDN